MMIYRSYIETYNFSKIISVASWSYSSSLTVDNTHARQLASSGVNIGYRIMHLMRDKLIHSTSMATLVYLLMQLLSLLVTFFSLMVVVSFIVPS